MASLNSAQPLNVIIVGAGIGGLTTAVALRRAGHHVKVYESSRIKTEIGAGVALQVNSVRVLKSLGYERENLKGGVFDGIKIFNAETAESNEYPTLNLETFKQEGINGLSCHRSDLHNELRRLATEDNLNSTDPPVELHLGSRIVGCDAEAGAITLGTGETVAGDLVIGADGVHSIVRTSVLGQDIQAEPSGWFCYRCIFDASELDNYPELAWVKGIKNVMSVRLEDAALSEYIVYNIRGSTLINMVAFDVDSERHTHKPTSEIVTKEAFLEKYPKFHPQFTRLFDLPLVTPVIKWQLRAMPMLPTWIRGRTVIMGDAAHATLPLLAQGAGMAIEEAACLGILLAAGTTPDQVPARLEAFQALRKDRGEFVNVQSVAQTDPENRAKFMRRSDFQAYLVEYDTISTTQKYYDTHFGGVSAGL
ncbi:FAD/NAD(P)-binding domain-containing protein [Mycena indigotica]|uniref:FAD/NAD(P)-binding domain-containing protein n=1 Tax=Mycena indigotica TaxID=2126181 RepID=A0A8H6T7Z3_9AGAR|nr:FAD/NAD(P)-binding domain-containing protein [Mycena indigotica]KAF7312728.1 FAD/NAD(P)-binding domain-containing protein [Mycena indigotica]